MIGLFLKVCPSILYLSRNESDKDQRENITWVLTGPSYSQHHWKIAQIRQSACVYYFFTFLIIAFFHEYLHPFLLSEIDPLSVSGVLGLQYEVFWQTLPHWDGVLQRAQITTFVSTGWEMSLHRPPSLSWPQNMRIEMLMWHYEWEVKAVQPFVDRRPFGVIEMCAYSRVNAISRCSHSQHSAIAQALVGFLFMSTFERQLDILIMSCKCIPLYNASDY